MTKFYTPALIFNQFINLVKAKCTEKIEWISANQHLETDLASQTFPGLSFEAELFVLRKIILLAGVA